MLEAALLETFNTGSKEELLALHGIGKKRVEAILEVRLRFSSVTQQHTTMHTVCLPCHPIHALSFSITIFVFLFPNTIC